MIKTLLTFLEAALTFLYQHGLKWLENVREVPHGEEAAESHYSALVSVNTQFTHCFQMKREVYSPSMSLPSLWTGWTLMVNTSWYLKNWIASNSQNDINDHSQNSMPVAAYQQQVQLFV